MKIRLVTKREVGMPVVLKGHLYLVNAKTSSKVRRREQGTLNFCEWFGLASYVKYLFQLPFAGMVISV